MHETFSVLQCAKMQNHHYTVHFVAPSALYICKFTQYIIQEGTSKILLNCQEYNNGLPTQMYSSRVPIQKISIGLGLEVLKDKKVRLKGFAWRKIQARLFDFIQGFSLMRKRIII